MSPESFAEHFHILADAPNGVQKLREMILQLAVQGRLVSQDPKDEPASVLLEKVRAEKEKLIKEGKIRKQKPLPRIDPDEVPYKLPEGWVAIRLGELLYNGKASYGQNPNPELVNAKVVKVSNISNDGFFQGQFANRGYAPSEISELLVNGGDLLVVKSSGSAQNVRSGKTALCGGEEAGDVVASNFVMRLQRFSNEVVATFLWRLLNSPISRKFVEETVKTFTYPNLKWSDLSQWGIGLPPGEEQKRIVAKVDQLMGLCDELEARHQDRAEKRMTLNKACLKALAAPDGDSAETAWQRISKNFDLLYDCPENVSALRQAILQLAVQGRLVPQDPKDEPVSVLLEKIRAEKENLIKEGRLRKQKPLAPIQPDEVPYELPEGWELVRLGNVTEIVGGVTKGRKLTGKTTAFFPYLRVANVQRGYLDLAEIKEIEIPVDELLKYRLEPGDLLITEGGDWDKVGRTAIWNGEVENCLHQNHVFRARLIMDDVSRQWLVLFVNSPTGRSYFEGASKQTTNLASINMTQLRHCPIPIPSLAERERIVGKVDQLMALCDELEDKLTQSQSAAETLMGAVVNQFATSRARISALTAA